MKLTWLAGLLALALPAAAQAHWFGGWGCGFGVTVAPRYAYAYPAYVPAATYYSPPPVVYTAPTYVAPEPAYVPPPVVYSPGYCYTPGVYIGVGPRYPHYYGHHYYRRW